MKQQLLRFIVKLIPFSVVLFIIHYLLITYYFEDVHFFYSSYTIYLFLFFSTLFVYLLVLLVNIHFSDKTGFAFMGASMLKMLAAIIFLLPMLLNNRDNAFANLLSFFIPYFLYLVYETFYAVKLLNTQ